MSKNQQNKQEKIVPLHEDQKSRQHDDESFERRLAEQQAMRDKTKTDKQS